MQHRKMVRPFWDSSDCFARAFSWGKRLLFSSLGRVVTFGSETIMQSGSPCALVQASFTF